MLKVSAFYLEKQKSFIPKKNIFLAVVNIKTKKLCLLTQFSVKILLGGMALCILFWEIDLFFVKMLTKTAECCFLACCPLLEQAELVWSKKMVEYNNSDTV